VKTNNKDPWLAVNFSMFFPGLGQWYAGKPIAGIVFFITQIILLALALWSIFAPAGNTVIGLIELAIAVIFYAINILNAHLSVYYQHGNPSLEKIPRKHKNPWFAVCVSRVLPGLGQLYTDQAVSGLLFLTATLFLLKLDDFYTPLLIIPPLIKAISTYHAYITFPEEKKTPFYRSLVAVMAGLLFCWGTIWSQIPPWLNQRMFLIPSQSMVPTLQKGDRIFVKPLENELPKVGNIVVFQPPAKLKALDEESANQDNVYYVKRLIATPGDIVRIENGIVYINDRPLKENYIAEPPEYKWGPQTVPADSYFVLGDNRNDSFDSHLWGFLPKEYLFGKAYKIYWPPERVRSLLTVTSD
jgi:signal peptidase I